jgi:hypothetical protein
MTLRSKSRWVAGLLVAALAIATVAPAAEAGKRNVRYKKARVERKAPRHVQRHRVHGARGHHGPRIVEIHRGSDGLPALAFVGGLVLGAVLSHAADEAEACERDALPAYDYYDPYCERTFPTLAVYVQHLHRHAHPRIVHVIDAHSGNWVHTYRYYRGEWIDGDEDW